MCGEVKQAAYEQPFRSPLQGESLLEPNPGLKPRAILLCHFVAFAHSPIRRVAESPSRPFARSPVRRVATSRPSSISLNAFGERLTPQPIH
jgi:hypothetical protein